MVGAVLATFLSVSALTFDLQPLRAALGNESLVADVVAIYLESEEELSERMRVAAAREDWPEVARAAHALRGAVLAIAAHDVAPTLHELEVSARNGAAMEPLCDALHALGELRSRLSP